VIARVVQAVAVTVSVVLLTHAYVNMDPDAFEPARTL
jgi:hypothetical protein